MQVKKVKSILIFRTKAMDANLLSIAIMGVHGSTSSRI
jgi:hypothetical protein